MHAVEDGRAGVEVGGSVSVGSPIKGDNVAVRGGRRTGWEIGRVKAGIPNGKRRIRVGAAVGDEQLTAARPAG